MRNVILTVSMIVLMLAGVGLSACGQEAGQRPTPVPTMAPSPTPDMTVLPSPTPGRENPGAEGPFTLITTEQLRTMLENKDFVFVNVHIPYEGEIPQTDVFAPYDEIEQYLFEFLDREEKVVLYCRYGPMSEYAANTLVSLGYTNVYILDGGFAEWEAKEREAAGLPTPAAGPRIQFDEESIDLGLVPIALMESTTFTFRNIGDGPLEVRDVRVVSLEGC
jgi:rhodanese-related sulfurtransferase